MRLDVFHHFDPCPAPDRVLSTLDQIIALITSNQGKLMATIQDIQADLDAIKTQTGDYIAGRDAIDATLNATIADLTAKLAAGQADAAAVQAGIDAAFASAEADKALLAVPAPAPVEPAPAEPTP